MSKIFPNGAVFGFSTVVGVAIAVSAVSNASPAVATVATGALDEGDVVVSQSAWSFINNAVAEVGEITSAATDTAELLGFDTSNATLNPLGLAAMRLQVASGFVDFSEQGDPSTSGGDQQYWTGQVLEDVSGRQQQIPTFKNAKVFTLPLYYTPDAPWYAAAKLADALKQPVVLRCKLPNGDKFYRYGYMSFDSDPTMAVNTPMGNTMTFTAIGETTLVKAA